MTALLSGCGGSSGFKIDPNIVENSIQVGIAQQQHVLTVVTCPVGVTAKQGDHCRRPGPGLAGTRRT